MKKLALLFAMLVFAFGNAFAQSFFFDFEGQNAGDKVAQTLGEPWTTWSVAPGGSEDGVFAEVDGTMTAHFTYGNDQVVRCGGLTNGNWLVSFDMYIPNGKDAYNNILHIFNGTGSEWATEVNYHKDGVSSIEAGGVTTNFECPYDTWFAVSYEIDLDNDEATFFIDGTEVCTWQFSLQAGGTTGSRKIDAIDFYPPTSAAVSEYYVDNVKLEQIVVVEELINEQFDYTAGEHIAVAAAAAGNEWWTTWSGTVGGSEDGLVAELDGETCGHFTYGNDQVLLLGDKTSGMCTLSFDMYIPNGKDAYNNILHIFNGSGSEYATEVYYFHSSNGTVIKANNVTTTFTVPYDTWFNVTYEIDLDNDQAKFFVGGTEIYAWQFSLTSAGNAGTRQLGAADFYPPSSAAVSEYYVDNIVFSLEGGNSVPVVEVTPEEIHEALGEDDITSATVAISNSGNSIAEWYGYLDFGEGGAGTQSEELYYHDNNLDGITGIGSSGAYSREFGIRLPGSVYAGTAMGMKAVAAKFYVNTYTASDNVYTFRLYGQGMGSQPGELLAEKSITTTATSSWIEVQFDEEVYMTGQDMWVTVGLEQTAGEYPMTMDGGEYGEEQNGNWLSTSGGTFSHCYSAGSFGGAWLVNLVCQGEKIAGSWASIDKNEGLIHGGDTEVITVTLSTIGLIEDGEYRADFVVNTNDDEHAQIIVPVILDANITSVAEFDSKYEIYPNPATSMVNVKGENLSHVAIYNVAGQLVRVEKLNNVINTIDMNVESGVYFFSIYDNAGNNNVQRVVISK